MLLSMLKFKIIFMEESNNVTIGKFSAIDSISDNGKVIIKSHLNNQNFLSQYYKRPLGWVREM